MKLNLIFKDRFMRGAISGIIAGIVMNILSYTAVGIFNFGEDLATDYMAEMLFGRTAIILLDKLVSILAHILFTGFLGVVFSYLLLLFGSRFIHYKALGFSWSVWFMLYSVGILFEVPLLKTNTASTILIHFVTATVYGLVLAFSIAYMEKRQTVS